MGLGVSLFLLAAGAILAFAVEVEASGININTVGINLMVIGTVGLLLSLMFWSSFAPSRREETVVHEDHVSHRAA